LTLDFFVFKGINFLMLNVMVLPKVKNLVQAFA